MPDHFGSQADRSRYFEKAIWPHLTAAYNFARWIVRDHHDAEDVVQESLVKAFRSAETFRGTDVRPWLLAIVRNCAMDLLGRHKKNEQVQMDELPEAADSRPNPEISLVQERRRETVRTAIGRLPLEFRDALLLREMESMSYKEIAFVLKVPLGTVMSRLSRARALLVNELITQQETSHDVL